MKSVDVKESAVVEFSLPPPSAESQGTSVTMRELKRDLNGRSYSVEANRAGIFVESERFCQGWNAYVDGKRQPVFPANFLFRGVFLAAGKHRVDFRYEPRSFYWGACLSLLGLVVLGLVSAMIRQNGRFTNRPYNISR
jgi:uncharacterized membrane protein YfhO